MKIQIQITEYLNITVNQYNNQMMKRIIIINKTNQLQMNLNQAMNLKRKILFKKKCRNKQKCS